MTVRQCLFLVLGGFLAVFGVGALAAQAATSSCLPAPVQSWFSAGQHLAADPRPANVRVYVDGSGSMVGYIRAATPELRPVQDLISILPSAAATRGDRMSFLRFAHEITPISVSDSAAFASPLGYLCKRRGAPKSCDNQESHIDSVLEDIAKSSTRDLSIIVTDLWLTNSDLASSGPVALGLRLSNLFQQGRSIDVVGISAPYTGLIYDLPSGGTYNGARARPLFVILVGPAALVTAYRNEISASGSAAFAPEHIHHSLFTNDPFIGAAVFNGVLHPTKADDGFQSSAVITNSEFAHVQQFTVVRSELFQMSSTKPLLAAGQMDFSLRLMPGAVWSGRLQPITKIWMLRDEDSIEGNACTPTTWTPFGAASVMWAPLDAQAVRWRMGFNPGKDLIGLPAGHIFFIVSYLERGDIDTPNRANDWLRQWSFGLADQDALLRRRPVFFPVLNLSATASVLEAALQRANGPQRVPVGGFALVTQIGD